MLNPELKTAWLAALRSGEYAQGEGFLSAKGKYCCLGVLCEVSSISKITDSDRITTFFDSNNYQMIHIPSLEMCETWGVKREDFAPYWTMNDSDYSFAEIADAIEKDASL